MTRKHFNLMAASLAYTRPKRDNYLSDATHRCALDQWEATARNIAYTCETINPNFDTTRFMEACYV